MSGLTHGPTPSFYNDMTSSELLEVKYLLQCFPDNYERIHRCSINHRVNIEKNLNHRYSKKL